MPDGAPNLLEGDQDKLHLLEINVQVSALFGIVRGGPHIHWLRQRYRAFEAFHDCLFGSFVGDV